MRAFFYPGGASGHRVQRPAAVPRPSISICPFPPLTPEEIILDEENRSVLYAALDQLPPIQARRVYAHYILGKKKSEIARAENVEGSAVCDSIRRGLKNLSELLKNFH